MNTRPPGRGLKLLPRDTANFNARKLTCVAVIPAVPSMVPLKI